MGLDMFLSRKHYVARLNGTHIDPITSGDEILPIDPERVSYVIEEVGYWRKANAIHHWFVTNVQNGEDDCNPYSVSIQQLKELLHLCEATYQVIKSVNGTISNKEEVAQLLPTLTGFFFGSTDYDEGYVYDLEYTIDLLKRVIGEDDKLREKEWYTEYEYRASW